MFGVLLLLVFLFGSFELYMKETLEEDKKNHMFFPHITKHAHMKQLKCTFLKRSV